ncbi:MAG: hypothetical protein U0930_06675 [Pirellulales bacterium]
MKNYLNQYLKALMATIVVMVVYCLTVVPLIEPTEQKKYEIPQLASNEIGDQWWQQMFSASDWQLQDPTVVHNSRGVLLAKNWEQISSASWKLTPLTIILADKPTAESDMDEIKSQNVWIISAQEAIVHFEKPFDMRSSTMPSVQKGQLTGEILISQVNTATPQIRPWQLRTRDVSIDRRRIWTQQEVEIDFENSRIRGHDLRINLLSDILAKRSEGSSELATKYGPLEEIELMHLTELSIALKPGGMWANVDPSMLQLNQPVQDLPARVEALCGGRFTFNFSKETASLTGGVHLKHFLGGLPPDEFLCHRMNLGLQTQAESADGRTESTGVSLRKIDAYGIDSLEEFVGEKWVELRSPLVGASARAKRMHFNLNSQRIELFGKLEQPGATASIAELNYRGYKFQAPTLEYQAAPKGLNGQAAHAGWLAAQGAGELSSPPESQLGETHVLWQEKFVWAPTDVPGRQRIELSGQTLVEHKEQGFMRAEVLQIWLDRIANTTQSNAKWSGYQPNRILSQGKSVIATSKAQVKVQTLDVTFIPSQGPAPGQDGGPSRGLANPLDRLVIQPNNSGGNYSGPTAMLGSAKTKPAEQPIVVNGQSLVAKVATTGRQYWIDAMTIQGPLNLQSPINQSSAPWQVNGGALNLSTNPQGDLEAEIEGSPAVIQVADGSFQGPKIGFNQSQNRIWMDQPGEFTLPMELKSQNGSLKWAKPLQCTWKKRMVFDGSQVIFEGDIEILGTLQQADGLRFLKGTCQSLELKMAQPISLGQLGNLQQMNQQSQLQQIILRDNVDLMASQEDNQRNRTSRGRLRVPTTLTVHVQQEKIVAAGPGRGYMNMVSNRNVGSLTSTRNGAPTLDSVGLSYRDSLVVFMDRREVVVDGNVRILASPIQNWNEEPNPENITRLSPGQFACVSDQVKIYDVGGLNSTQSVLASQGIVGSKSQWEAQASGNVRFEGNDESGEYSGNANQIVYVQSRDLLRVAGDGRTKAIIRKLPTFKNGQPEPTTYLKLNFGEFNIKTRAIPPTSSGLEIHLENPDAPGSGSSGSVGQPSTGTPYGQPGNGQPGNGQTPPIDPRERAINRMLKGFGS